MVRFEVDACLGDESASISTSADETTEGPLGPTTDDVNELTNWISQLSVSSSPTNATQVSSPPAGDNSCSSNADDGDEIQIVPAGSLVPQSTLIELATMRQRSFDYYGFKWAEAFPQLLLTCTPHHFLGLYEDSESRVPRKYTNKLGVNTRKEEARAAVQAEFKTVRKRLIGDPDMLDVEKELQGAFRMLREVLGLIKEYMVGRGKKGGKIALVRKGETLSVHEMEQDKDCLPEKWMQVFNKP